MTKKERETIVPALEASRKAIAFLLVARPGTSMQTLQWAHRELQRLGEPITGKALIERAIHYLDQLKEVIDDDRDDERAKGDDVKNDERAKEDGMAAEKE